MLRGRCSEFCPHGPVGQSAGPRPRVSQGRWEVSAEGRDPEVPGEGLLSWFLLLAGSVS